jgi:hypothetical protein
MKLPYYTSSSTVVQTNNGYKSEHAQAVTFGLQKATSKISMKESIKILITGQKPTWTTQILHGGLPCPNLQWPKALTQNTL